MRTVSPPVVLLLALLSGSTALAQQTRPQKQRSAGGGIGTAQPAPPAPAAPPPAAPAPAPAAPAPKVAKPSQAGHGGKTPVNPQAPVEQNASPQQFTDPYGKWGNGKRPYQHDVTGTVVGGPGGTGMVQTGVSLEAQVGAGAAPRNAQAVAEEEERQGGGNATLSLSGDQLVGLMGDPIYSPSGREDAAKELLDGGLEAVPALLGHLGDKRIYSERPAETGATRVTVGQACDTMLYSLVTPRYRSIHAPKGAVTPSRYFQVDDWKAFWAARQGRTLADVRAELRTSVDQYWQTGGTVQTVK